MAQIKANGIDIEYETRGDRKDPALVLVRGLGTQLIEWPEDYLTAFVEAGFFVIIFDNRDVGMSQKFDSHGPGRVDKVVAALKEGREPELAYRMEDMAADAIGLLDALEIENAHIAGMSMGGIIVQYAAALYPNRLLSATSIMSGIGTPGLPQPGPDVQKALLEVYDGDDLDGLIDFNAAASKVFTGKGRPTPDEMIWERNSAAITRCYYPEGTSRQYAAIVASGDRGELCSGIIIPFLVVHGVDDPLVLKEAGIDTAEKVPGAKLHLVEGMGHDLPPSCLEEVTGVIIEHMKSVRD